MLHVILIICHTNWQRCLYLQCWETFFSWTRLSLVRSGFFAFPNLNPCKSRDFASAAKNFLHLFLATFASQNHWHHVQFLQICLKQTLNAGFFPMFLRPPTRAISNSSTSALKFGMSQRSHIPPWQVKETTSNLVGWDWKTQTCEVQTVIILHHVLKKCLLLCHGNWLWLIPNQMSNKNQSKSAKRQSSLGRISHSRIALVSGATFWYTIDQTSSELYVAISRGSSYNP